MDELLEMGKRLVMTGDILKLQQTISELHVEEDLHVDWVWLFQKLYIYAALKKQRAVAEWMETALFPTLDPIAQIGIRQTFAYGRYLLRR